MDGAGACRRQPGDIVLLRRKRLECAIFAPLDPLWKSRIAATPAVQTHE